MRNEKALIERVLNNEQQAFTEVVQRYEKLVKYLVFGLVKDERDRQELVQDIFVKVFKRLHSFRFQSKLSTWIGKICYNHCLNYLRRKHIRIKFKEIESFKEWEFKDLSQENLDKAASDRKQKIKLVQRAIEQLPDNHQIIIKLFYAEELTYEEIGDILKIPQGTVKSKLFRARQFLKTLLIQMKKKEKDE